MFPDWALGVIGIIGTVAAGIVLLTGLRVLAQRGRSHPTPPDPLLEGRVTQALDEVNRRLAELEERVDFAERMLASQKEKDKLPS